MKSVRTIDLRAWRLCGFTCTTLATWAAKELQQASAHGFDLAAQLVVLESVSTGLSAHNDIGGSSGAVGAQHVQNPDASQLSQPTLEPVPLDRRVAVLRDHEADPGHSSGRGSHSEIEVCRAEPFAIPHGGAQLATARQSMTPQ